MRIEDATFSFFDTETTGIDPYVNDHRIVQAAVVRTRGGRIVDTYQTLINPERPIPAEVVSIHGISNDMIETEPVISEVLPVLLGLLQGTYVVIHNARFDLGFLDFALQEGGLPPVSLTVVDTLEVARSYMSFPGNSLRRIARSYGIRVPGRHGALEDADILRRVFDRFLEELRIETTEKLMKLRGTGRLTIGDAPRAPAFWRDAIERRIPVEVEYRSSWAVRRRTIIPLRYMERYGQGYIVAFCRLRNGRRVFRLDRLTRRGLENQ